MEIQLPLQFVILHTAKTLLWLVVLIIVFSGVPVSLVLVPQGETIHDLNCKITSIPGFPTLDGGEGLRTPGM